MVDLHILENKWMSVSNECLLYLPVLKQLVQPSNHHTTVCAVSICIVGTKWRIFYHKYVIV